MKKWQEIAELACEFLEQASGSCPLEACGFDNNCERRCGDEGIEQGFVADCWLAYFESELEG